MALSTLPTFSPSGYVQFSTARPAPLPSANPTAYSVATAVALPAGSAPATVLIQNLGPEAAIVLLAAAAATTTGTAAQGATALTVASPTNIAIDHVVVGAGIANGTSVTAINGNVLTLSQPTFGALNTTAVNFVVPVTGSTGIAVMPRVPLALAYVSSGFICAICFNLGGNSVLNVSVGV